LDADAPGAGESRGIRQRISGQAEDAIGRLADDLLSNEVINSALQRALGAREKIGQAQESAMEALNLPSASNVEKLARRLRSISQRLEEIEDAVDRVDRRMGDMAGADKQRAQLEERLDRIESRLDQLGKELIALRGDVGSGDAVASAAVPEG
jgi:chromosome segregation ATPase